jgi:hypothetical protein
LKEGRYELDEQKMLIIKQQLKDTIEAVSLVTFDIE